MYRYINKLTCIKFDDKFRTFKLSSFFRETKGNSIIKLLEMSNFSSFSAPI